MSAFDAQRVLNPGRERYINTSEVLGDELEYVILAKHPQTGGLIDVNREESSILQPDPEMGRLFLAKEEEFMIVLRDSMPHALNSMNGGPVAKPGGNDSMAAAVVSQDVEDAGKGGAGEDEEEQVLLGSLFVHIWALAAAIGGAKRDPIGSIGCRITNEPIGSRV
jgi:hypothetical protein